MTELLTGECRLQKEKAFEMTLHLCVEALKELSCTRSLSILLLIQYGEWDQVASGLACNPLDYADADSFARAYQANRLLVKADFLPTSFDKRTVALERFESAESQCYETNKRWRAVYVDGRGNPPPGVDRIVSMARRNIEHILGRFPYEKLRDVCRWGPGATTSIRNPRTSAYEKYLEPVTGSGQCFTVFESLVTRDELWRRFQNGRPWCIVKGNRVVLVPKNAKTLRSIASEPTFDSYCQLGIGRLMRRQLLHHGVDLATQETNRDLARYGSLTGKVATVDKTMASDTSAKVVVEYMFPSDWVLAMQACRSPSWQMGDSSGIYSKFSSMGNGYTFEMETVLFYAVAKAVADDLGLPWWEVTAFGDDVTIGVEGVNLYTEVLSFMGFSVNTEKSFSSGPFRESCGKDYFLGSNVRPYHIGSLLYDVRDLIKFHNGVCQASVPMMGTAAKALRLVIPEVRIFGPRALGDTVFWSAAPRGKWKLASQRYPMYEGYIIRHWVFKPDFSEVKFLEPALMASLSGASPQEPPAFNRAEVYRWKYKTDLTESGVPTLGKSIWRQRGVWATRTVIIPGWDD